MNPIFDKNLIRKYVQNLRDSGVRSSVIASKLKSLKKYVIWSANEKIIDSQSFRNLSYFLDQEILQLHESLQERIQYKLKSLMPQRKSKVATVKTETALKTKAYTPQALIGYALLVILISFLGAGIYNQFFIKVSTPFAFPNTLTRGTRIISFQGRLTDSLGNPIVAQTDVVFKLYNVSSGGSPLYTGSCTGVTGLTPDQDGIFNALVGQDCSMSEIPSSVFTENANVYLGVTVGSDSEMTPRQQIANVGYALNAETLQGLPPGQTPASIPYINNQGDVLMAAATPGIRSTYASATFNITSANAVTVASAGSGDVTLNASQSGTIKLQTANTDRITIVNGGNIGIGNVTNPSSFNVQIAGTVGPNATDTYDLGSISKEWRNIYGQALFQNGAAVCDALGNNCNVAGGWTDDGQVVRLTTSTDQVGIGTTNPISKLQVNGAITGKALTVFNETGDQAILAASASGVTKFLVNHAGNVGIGVTNPGNLLDIGGSTVIGTYAGSSSGPTNGLAVSGNIGIGTTNPLEKLDVQGNATISGNLTLSGGARAIQTAAFNSLTLGGSTTGDIFLQPKGTAASAIVQVGAGGAGSTTPDLFGVDVKSDAGDPSLGANGFIYYNANSNKLRCYENGAWTNCIGAGSITGSGIAGQVTFWNGTSAITGDNSFFWDNTNKLLGIGNATPVAKLDIAGAVKGKALTIFNETGDQAILTASASGTPRMTVLNNGNLQFHQASSITTTTGNLTLDSTGGTTTISDNAVITGTSDLQGSVANSTGNVVIADTADIGSATTGLRIDTAGNVIDIDGNIVLNDTTDIGSSSTGINVSTAGALSDIDGNLVLNDQTDIGSATTGIRITTAGAISDIDGNVAINDNTDITGDTTITGNLNVSKYATVAASLAVGYNSVKPGPGNAGFSGNVGIGTSNPTHRLELGADTSAAGGIDFGTDVDLYRSAADTLALATGDSFNIVSGSLQFGSTTVINSSRQLSNIAGISTSLTPTAANTYALGTATTNQYSTIYGQSIFVNGVAVCDANGNNCPASSGSWTLSSPNLYPTQSLYRVAIGTTTTASMISQLYVTRTIADGAVGKALAVFNQTENQDLFTASASGTPRFTVLNNGNLQFHQASSITTTTGNLTLDSTGGTTTISDNAVITGTTDLQGSVANSTGNVVLADTVDIGSATTGLRVDTAGSVIDIDGNIVLNDQTDIGSATTGLRVDTAGNLLDIDGNLVLNDTTDIGSSSTGINVSTTGGISDIDGDLVLVDTVDIGSATTGVNVTTNGALSDIDGNLVLNDTTDIGSSSTGINVSTAGALSDIDGDLVLNDQTDIGSATTGLQITTAGAISDIDGNVAINDNTDITGNTTITGNLNVSKYATVAASLAVGYNSVAAGPGNAGFSGNVGIGTSNPTHRLELGAGGTAAAQGIGFGTDVDLYRGASARLDLGSGQDFNIVSGALQFGSTTVINSSRQLSNIAGVTTSLTPTAANTYALGTATTNQYSTIYGQSIFVNGNAVCDSAGNNCPAGTSAWTLSSPNLYPQQSLYRVGIGTTTTASMISQLYVTRTIADGALGKALAIFNQTENQDLFTASASGTPRFTVTNAGNLQFHQASSITTTTGNLTLDSTGGTTTISDNAVITGTSDLQGSVANSTGNVVIADTADIGSATTGLRIDTAGNVIDIDGNIVLNDTTDIGSSSTGLNVSTAGALSDIDGDLVLNDQTDIGSATTGLQITTAGGLSDIDGNVAIADTTDITGGLTVSQYATVSATLNVGYATAKPGPGNGVFSGNVGIGTSNPTHQLELGAGTAAQQGINFGTDVDLYRSAADILSIGTGDSFNIVSGNLQFGSTTVINSSRQLSNIAGITTSLTPTAANTYALGTATTNQYSTIYGQSIFVNGSAVCDAAGNNCPTGLYINLQGSTPGTQQIGNLNISGAALVGYLADTSNSNYGIDPAGTSNFGGFSLKVTGASLLALDSGNVGIGTGTPLGKLHVDATAVGKALAIFNDSGTDQDVLTASAAGTPIFTIKHNGNVGIGTTSPNYKLTVSGSAATVGSYTATTLTGSTNTAAAVLSRGDLTNGYAENYYATAGTNVWEVGLRANSTDYQIYDSSSGNARVRLDTTGNLNLVAGALNFAGTTVINSSRQLNNIAGVTTSLTPTAANTYALGTATTNQYSTIYGQSVFVNGVAVCDANGNNCPASSSGWTLSAPTLYATASTSRIGIGTTTTSAMTSMLNVTRTLTDGALGKALAVFNQTENQPILAASASGTTKFIIDYTGNVGIGTTTPAGKLTISQASTTSTDGLYITDASANTGRLYVGSSGSFRLQAGTNNTQLVLHSAGNVGIGTTNPLAQFAVGSTSQFQVNSTGNLTAINGVTYSWPGSQGGSSTVLTNNGSGTLTWASVGTLTGTGATGQVAFWNGTTTQAGTNSFFWDNTNNLLGIGLNAPVAKLHLDGAVKGKALAIFNETGDQDVFDASASGTNVFAIKHNGNVGIGTTAPGAKLEIGGTTSTISNTAGNINITPTADLVLTSGNLGIGASPVAGGKLYLDTSNSNTLNSVTMNVGNIASTTQNNWSTLNLQNGGTGLFDLELVRGMVNQQGINYFNDDFLDDGFTSTRWAGNGTSGTGATCTIPTSVAGGVARMTTGTTSGAYCRMRIRSASAQGAIQQDNNPVYEASVKPSNAGNTQRLYFGFMQSFSTALANAFTQRQVMIGKRTTDTTWQCITSNGTTQTFTNIGVNVSTTAYQRLRISLSNGSTPQAVCSVDGTSVSVTTTLPGTGQLMDVYAYAESTGTSATQDVDYIRVWSDDPPGLKNSTPAAPVAFNPVEKADIAERYLINPSDGLEAGDVVDIGNDIFLKKSNGQYDKKVLGIISTTPGQQLGMLYGDNLPLALNGRVPVKVSAENGPIRPGDYLTTSSIPGVAMKATASGVTIGKALESYDNTDKNAVGKVLVFVNLSWFDPQVAVSSNGDLALSSNQSSLLPQLDYNSQVTVTRATASTVTNANGDVLSATTGYAKVVAGTILTGLTDTQNAIVSNILSARTIIATSIKSASGSFTAFTSTTLTAVDGTLQRLTVSQKITSPVVETDNLKVNETAQINNVETNTIKPQNDNVTIDLSNPTDQGALANVIIKGMEGKTVTTLDAAGNATFSGTITSNKVETKDASVSGQLAAGSLNTNEASVSGTLTAKEIKADNIDALANNLGLTQNSIASQSSNLQQLSSNVNDIQKILTDLKNQPLPDPTYYQNLNQPVNVATQASAMNLEKLTVTDNANMYDVSIAHNLSVGSMIITDGSILSLSWELKLSSLGTINLFDGGVVIAKDGTITTQGSIIAKGGIKTNDIEAISPNDNVNVKLASKDVVGQPDVQNTKLAVQNNQGLEVASIDASGSAQFKDLSLDKYLDATNSAAVIPAATNFTNNGIYAPALQTDRKTIGVGRLPASQSEIIIYNEKVKTGSLIYVTSTSALQNKNLFVADKHTCAEGETTCKPYFKVSISGGPMATDVTFNWWIVN